MVEQITTKHKQLTKSKPCEILFVFDSIMCLTAFPFRSANIKYRPKKAIWNLVLDQTISEYVYSNWNKMDAQ